MQRIVCNIPDDIAPIFRYHLATEGKRVGEYVLMLITKDLMEKQPVLMKNIKK